MKPFVILLLLLSNLNLILNNPILQIETNTIKTEVDIISNNNTLCLNNQTISHSLDISSLEGEWYDIARTNNHYKNSTWSNGLALILVDKESSQYQLYYSGLDSNNDCQKTMEALNISNTTQVESSSTLTVNETIKGILTVLAKKDDYVIVSLCYDEANCQSENVDLYVWSRDRLNTTLTNKKRDELMSILNEYCVFDINNVLFSNHESKDVCKINLNEKFETTTALTSQQDIIGAEIIGINNDTLVKILDNNNDNETVKNSMKESTNSSIIAQLELITNTNNTKNISTNITIDLNSELLNLNETESPETTTINIESVNDEVKVITNEPVQEVHATILTSTEETDLVTTQIEKESTLITTSSDEKLGITSEDESSGDAKILFNDDTSVLTSSTTVKTFYDATMSDESSGDSEINIESTTLSKQKSTSFLESNDLSIAKLEDQTLTTASSPKSNIDDILESDEEILTKNRLNYLSTQLPKLSSSTSSLSGDDGDDDDEQEEEVEEVEEENETNLETDHKKNDLEENENENEEDREDDDDSKNDKNKSEETEEDDEKDDEEISSETTTIPTSTTTTTTTTTTYPCIKIECPILHCNYGKKLDENGCELCECQLNPNTTEQSECTTPYCHPCFYGAYTDENGCESCACKPRPKPKSIYECPKLDCVSCNYGSIKDEYGCETCICIRPNSLERAYSCPPEPICPFGTCKHGSLLNEYGCATCECLKSTEPDRDECVRQRCAPCSHGYFTDADGCETCLCKPDWMAPCALNHLNCDLSKCLYGSYLDRNGCPSCECLPNPEFKVSCSEMSELNSLTQCNEDGTFKYKQCNDQECRCVTKDGIPISDFKASLNESETMNCECAIVLYEVSVYKTIGYKLYCLPNGNYETIQCVGGSCACVNEHGDPLGPSVPIYQKHLLRCEGVFQRVYYNQFMTTRSPTTLTQPLCLYHREKALEMSDSDAHLPIPVCDENGLYKAQQCDRQNKYCWCVNVHNGIELYGTKKASNNLNCSSTSG